MKILMVSNYLFHMGGVETYMTSLGDRLADLGCDVQYFGMKDKKNVVGNKYNIYINRIDLQKKSLKNIFLVFKIIYSLEAKRKIKKLIKLYRPDIVHINNINFGLTPSIIYGIKKFNIPIIKTVHDAQLVCPAHRLFIEHKMEPCMSCITGKYNNCLKNKCISNSRIKSFIATLESYLYHRLQTYNIIDEYVFPSEFMKNVHITNGFETSKLTKILNYSRLDFVKSKESPIENEPYCLYFGRLSKEKGIETFIKVIKKLPNVKFVFVGKGPLEYLLKNVNNIDFLGFRSGDDLTNIIKNAKFSVYPSEWYENSPLSVLESQALGTPVIGANIGGIPELIQNNITGLLFESGNEVDLYNKILELYDNEEKLRLMSENCLTKNKVSNLTDYANKIMIMYENQFKKGGTI